MKDVPMARLSPLGRVNLRLRRVRYRGQRIDWAGYLFVLPFFTIFTTFVVGAVAFSIYISGTEWSIIGKPEWIGIANYVRAFKDPWVPKVWGNTAKYTLIVVPLSTLLGLIFAVFVDQRLLGYTAARLSFYAPRVVSVTVVGLVWVWLLDARFGLVNQFLGLFGVSDIPWLTSTRYVLFGVAITSIWWVSGFNMVIFLAALQDVPHELREAALIDGANAWQVFWYIVVPFLRPALSLVITLGIIEAFRVFGQIYVMTAGGPAGASATVIWYIFDRGFQQYEFGYAAALSILLFFTILAVTIVEQRLVRETTP
ncbi:MAG: carbohydrate ABC transporter permease [Anaerolineae bacterium]